MTHKENFEHLKNNAEYFVVEEEEGVYNVFARTDFNENGYYQGQS